MAGSYNHIITDRGNLVSNEMFIRMIENLGDAYEMTEEMYGMIWWLATPMAENEHMTPEERVEDARKNYKAGLRLAKTNQDKRKHDGR